MFIYYHSLFYYVNKIMFQKFWTELSILMSSLFYKAKALQ